MRVAVCIAGQLRNVEKAFPNIYQNIILPNNADVFIHAWYDETMNVTDGIQQSRCPGLPENIHLKTLDLYKPKKYIFEKPKDFSRSYKNHIVVNPEWIHAVKDMNLSMPLDKCYEHTIKCTMSMYYSFAKANELKELYAEEQGLYYDYVIRLRFDLHVSSPILVKELDPNYLYYVNIHQPDSLISDWLNIGSNKIMNVYASIYNNLEYLNTFEFYKKSERPSTSFRGSDACIWGNEYFVRDIMHLFKIPARHLNIHARIIYE